jgi:hypothetical protein
VNHVTSVPSGEAAPAGTGRSGRDQYDHYYLYVQMLYGIPGRP